MQAHLNIYISKVFQWYKKLFNPMNFESWNYFLKIWESIKILILKMGAHLGVCGSFIPTFLHSWDYECDSQASFSACTFLNLYFGHEPKVRVVTPTLNIKII
jgi:hypothetical protein